MLRATKKVLSILNIKQRRRLIGLGIMMLIGGIMESLSVSLILPLIQAIMNEKEWKTSWYARLICDLFHIDELKNYVIVMLLMLIAVFILKNLYLFLEYYLQYLYICKTRFFVQHKLMSRYLHRPYEFFLNASSGELYRTIASDTVQTFALLNHVVTFFTEIIVAVVLGITIIAMSPQMGFGIMAILGLEVLVIAKIVKPVLKLLGNSQRYECAKTNKWILQSINGIKSIKVSNTETFFEEKYLQHAKKMVEADCKNLTIQNIPRLVIEALTVVGVLIMILVMILCGAELKDIIPQLSAFVVAAIRLLPCINRLSGAVNQIPFLEGALDNVIRELNYKVDISASLGHNETKSIITDFKENVIFDNISYKYEHGEKNIFDKATFEIHKGESVGVIGSSGAGKTTAIDIMLGLLKPDEGFVKIDGVDIEKDMDGWLSRLAYIPQSIFLVDDSIKANVAFGLHSDEVNEEKVWSALKEAQLDDFVKNLPEGIETKVGEQGVRLSGGQKQRIGIARALYNDPEILFFDEATSALDNETEKAIMESVENLKGRKTLIIIAHRLTTIENCEKVYCVENGKVERKR